MAVIIAGLVKNGVVVPNVPLPEGAHVEIRLKEWPTDVPSDQTELIASQQSSGCSVDLSARGEPRSAAQLTPTELRRMPRDQRQAILVAAVALAEQDYRSDEELTGFETFSEDERDGDESDSG